MTESRAPCPVPAPGELPARCLCIDIETDRNERARLLEVGAYRPDLGARVRIAGNDRNLAPRLDELSRGASLLLGHNIVAHDLPVLALLHPDLALHRLPFVDTLALSPIAFPQNPYHRLVKDYKLVSTTRNDPVRDAELSHDLFRDECAALENLVRDAPHDMTCLHHLLASNDGAAVSQLVAYARGAPMPSLDAASDAWRRAVGGRTCDRAGQQVLRECLPDPAWHVPLAYALSWLWCGRLHPLGGVSSRCVRMWSRIRLGSGMPATTNSGSSPVV